jgi:hypothetical protein
MHRYLLGIPQTFHRQGECSTSVSDHESCNTISPPLSRYHNTGLVVPFLRRGAEAQRREVKHSLDPSHRMTPVEPRCVVDERESQPTYLFPPGVAWLPMVMVDEVRHFERHPESKETKAKMEPKKLDTVVVVVIVEVAVTTSVLLVRGEEMVARLRLGRPQRQRGLVA